MYKLRFYNRNGDFTHEVKFYDVWEMIAEYKKVFVKYSANNPTAWYNYDPACGDEWVRLKGF